MTDATIRSLARQAAQGDPEAQRAYGASMRRAGFA